MVTTLAYRSRVEGHRNSNRIYTEVIAAEYIEFE